MSTDSSTVIEAGEQSVIDKKRFSGAKENMTQQKLKPESDEKQGHLAKPPIITRIDEPRTNSRVNTTADSGVQLTNRVRKDETPRRKLFLQSLSLQSLKKNKSASARNSNKLTWDRYLVRVVAVICAVILWQLCSTFNVNFIVNFENIPAPDVVGEKFIILLNTQEFYTHILVSLQRIAISFSMAVVLGIIAGVFMGRSKIFSDIMLPYIEILRPIPAVAWIPLAILMFPTEESSIIYITFLGAFFPIVLNTVHGVEQTEENLVRAAKSLGANNRAILWHVVLPGALPSIMAGLAIGMGVSWFSLLAGEIISGQYGIGYFTWNSYTLVEYPNIIIGMLTIGGLGTLSTWLVKKSSRPALRWQGTQS